MPQGYIASGDGYSRHYDEVVASFPQKTKCIDDTLLWSDTIQDCFFQAAQWLDICGRNGITLNPDKFTFAQDVVEFAEFEITRDIVHPCNRFLRAITEFPTPTNITDVRSCSIKCRVPSAWLNGCFHLEVYSNQLHHSVGMTTLIDYLRNPKL